MAFFGGEKNIRPRISDISEDFKKMDGIKELVRENLVRLRKENKLTQIELSGKIGYSDKAISRWETGEVTPDIETLDTLAKLYGVPVTYFFERERDVKREEKKERSRNTGRKWATSLLTIACLWYIVIIYYITASMRGTPRAWLAFIWALPASFFLARFFSKRWGPKALTIIFTSLFAWTLILSVYLQFIDYNMFLLFTSGAPLQAVIILWAFVKPTKADTRVNEK